MKRTIPMTLLLAFALPASAAEYAIDPMVELHTEYTDNPTLTPNESEKFDTQIATLSASASATVTTPRSRLAIRPRLALRRSDVSTFDSDEQELYINGSVRSPKRLLSLGASYRRLSLVTSELVDAFDDTPPDEDNPTPDEPSDDTGIVEGDSHRTSFFVAPSVVFNISEVAGIRAGASYSDVRFDATGGSSLSDYDRTALSLAWFRNLGQRTQVSTAVFVGDYEAPATRYQADSVSIFADVTHQFSELWSVGVNAGFQMTDATVGSGFFARDIEDETAVFGASARRRFERGQFSATFDRVIAPSGSGSLTRRDEIHVYMSHQLGPRLGASGGVRLIRADEFAGFNTQVERDYFVIDLGANWRLSEHWSLGSSFRYRQQEFDSTVGNGEASSLFLGVTYNARRRAWSR